MSNVYIFRILVLFAHKSVDLMLTLMNLCYMFEKSYG